MAKHKHEVIGKVIWTLESDTLSVQVARCKCGETMTRRTAPIGAKFNWLDWVADND